MKKLTLFSFLLAIAVALFFAGCGKDNPVEPGNGNGGQFGFYNFGGASPTHFLVLSRVTSVDDDSITSIGMGIASLNNQDKGDMTVTVNNTTYSLTKIEHEGQVFYFTDLTANPFGIILGSQPTSASFSVTGYQLTNSSVTVPGEIYITSPTDGSNFSRNQALTVTLNSASGVQNNLVIVSDYDGNEIIKMIGAGATSASFSAAEMGTLIAGFADVTVYSYNFSLSNNNEAVIIGQTVNNIEINLQ
jgi:hypothetical protein